jgi:Tol biopolymer transport system component
MFCPTLVPLGPSATNPNWSSDGNLIAFVQTDQDVQAIYTIRPDGTGLVRLADNPGGLGDGRWWSPDGRQIAFAGDHGISVVDVDGSGSHLVVACEDTCTSVGGQSWSPDGSAIAFIQTSGHGRSASRAIYTVDADGTALRKVVDCATSVAGCVDLAWSPDGMRLVFSQREDDPGTDGLFVVNVDGSGLTRIADGGLQGLAWTS